MTATYRSRRAVADGLLDGSSVPWDFLAPARPEPLPKASPAHRRPLIQAAYERLTTTTRGARP